MAKAVISSLANVAASVRLGHFVVVSDHCSIGAYSAIGHGTTLGSGVVIGENCHIGDGVHLHNCQIGSHVILQNGVSVGQDGFGFILSDDGRHEKKPQTLGVIIGDHVEVGANTTIDRGSWRDTVLGTGSKLDNLVQIGHNVRIGENCIIAAQCGIGGSVSMGNRVFVGAQTGIHQHVSIGDSVRIAAKSGVMRSLVAGQTYGGNPAVPIRMQHRRTILVDRMAKRTIANISQGR